MMKRVYSTLGVAVMGLFMLLVPARVDALIWLNGTSQSGKIVTSGAILVPIPLINLTITTSRETDFFGIAQLTISDYDDNNYYNTLQISTAAEDPIHLPVPYGSLGLIYLMRPQGFSPPGIQQSDLYGYLSVARRAVTATIESSAHFSISIDREQLIALATPVMPGFESLAELVGEGPFEIEFILDGSLSGTATETDPTIAGSFDYYLTLPEDLFTSSLPPDMPVPEAFQGNLSVEASFTWDMWSPFLPFVSVSLSLTHTFQGEELPFDPVTFDFLPRGTTLLWLDRDE